MTAVENVETFGCGDIILAVLITLIVKPTAIFRITAAFSVTQ